MVRPDDFALAMTKHWHELGNKSSDSLREAWRTMAYRFNLLIVGDPIDLNGENSTPPSKEWNVIPMPTGTGKTQGLCLYCSMLNKEPINRPAVLIITRLTEEGDKIRDTINKLAQSEIAVSYHGKNKDSVTMKIVRKSPILIVTHSAFANTLEAVANGNKIQSNWDDFTSWSGGSRKLTVIDESLDMLRSYHLTKSDLINTLKLIPSEIKQIHPIEINALKAIQTNFPDKNENLSKNSERLQSPSSFKVVGSPDFTKLLQTLQKHRTIINRKVQTDGLEHETDGQSIKSTILAADLISKQWSLNAQWKGGNIVSAAYLILPEFIKKAVILDATAEENPIYHLLQDYTEVIKLPKTLRTYSNVTIHVNYNHQVGKQSITTKDKKHFSSLLEYIKIKIPHSRRVLFCTHKKTVPLLSNYREAFAQTDNAHWGAIDGRNDWNSYNTMVIYGLPYLKPVDHTLSILAFKDWTKRGSDYSSPFIDKTIKEMASHHGIQFLIVRLIQAINRVHCRRVIDAQGNCENTDIFLFLNKETSGKKLIAGITKQMPNIKIKVLTDSPNSKSKGDNSKNAHAIVEYLRSQPSGKYPVHELQAKINFSESTLRRLLRKTNTQSWLAIELSRIGVIYQTARGRNAVSYFLKSSM